MQNTSNDTKQRYKLVLRSILILECDFRFNFNLVSSNLVFGLSDSTFIAPCLRGYVAKCFLYILYSDKTWDFDQSECVQGPICIINENKQ